MLSPSQAPEAPAQHGGRGRAGIKGPGKLGRTTRLDVRSPLIDHKLFLLGKRSQKPLPTKKESLIFKSFMLLSPRPPSLPRRSHASIREISICKTICKAGVEYILLFKKQIFHVVSCGDFCDVAFLFFLFCVCVKDGCQRHQPNKQL